MTRKNPHPESNPDRADALLDAALAQYSEAGPRAGLEERILTNLRLREHPVRRSGWLPIVVAAAIALLAIPSYFVWRETATQTGTEHGTPPTREHVARNLNSPRQDDDLRPEETAHSVEPGQAHKDSRVRAAALSPVRAPKRESGAQGISTDLQAKFMAKPGPRLNQFPAASPLTEQEILLARYGQLVHQAASAESSPIKDLKIEALNVAPIAIDQPEK